MGLVNSGGGGGGGWHLEHVVEPIDLDFRAKAIWKSHRDRWVCVKIGRPQKVAFLLISL